MTAVTGIRLVLVLTEQHVLVPPRDLDGLVSMAVQAEQAGIDAVMCSEHIVLGRTADAGGPMANERDYAAPGNQHPATPWPSSLVLLSAMAARTSRLRLAAAAVIAPLRHPLLLAKFYSFDDVWLEPGPWRSGGPTLWFGGQGMHPPLVRRIVRYGHGVNPFGPLTDDDLAALAHALQQQGRSLDEIELVGGVRGRFSGADDVADLDEALQALPAQVARGFGSICVKPAMFLGDPHAFPTWCRELVDRVEQVTQLPVVVTPPSG